MIMKIIRIRYEVVIIVFAVHKKL